MDKKKNWVTSYDAYAAARTKQQARQSVQGEIPKEKTGVIRRGPIRI